VKSGGSAPEDWEKQLETKSRPVVNVSWNDAQEYCRWVKGVRLPSEEQWELAARGKEGRIYPWGNRPEPDEERANFDSKVGAPTPVGLFPKGNTWEGLADMAGNVWEWTDSDYDKETKVVRGGAFDSVAGDLRGAIRNGYYPDNSFSSIGFRLVRE
jgi:formylglycine-generating enzyme required for sulfatase activity